MTNEELRRKYREAVASFSVQEAPLIVVRFKYDEVFEFHLTGQLFDGAEIKDENNQDQIVKYAPMDVSDETSSSSEILLADRVIVIQGLNDYIAYYEDQIPSDVNLEDGVVVSVMVYLIGRNGVVSNPVEVYDYYMGDIDYAQDGNSVRINITTSPTNDDSTGEKATVDKFITLRGFL